MPIGHIHRYFELDPLLERFTSVAQPRHLWSRSRLAVTDQTQCAVPAARTCAKSVPIEPIPIHIQSAHADLTQVACGAGGIVASPLKPLREPTVQRSRYAGAGPALGFERFSTHSNPKAPDLVVQWIMWRSCHQKATLPLVRLRRRITVAMAFVCPICTLRHDTSRKLYQHITRCDI
jgi:hypothetical protein